MRTIALSTGIAFGSIAFGFGAILLAASFTPASIFQPAADSESQGANEQFLQLHGRLDVLLYDESGSIKDERHFDNMIVDAGFEGVAYRIAPHDGTATNSPWNYIAIGTGSTAPAAGDIALAGSELARLQDAIAAYTATPNKQLELEASFGPGVGTGNVAESGLFNAASGGDMLARQTFTPISKGASDTLTVTWTITLSS